MNMNFIREVQVRQECLSEDSYIRQIPALNGFSGLVLENPLTFLVGENGSGKSTLLEGIAVAWGFNPEGERETSIFPPATPIRSWDRLSGWLKA